MIFFVNFFGKNIQLDKVSRTLLNPKWHEGWNLFSPCHFWIRFCRLNFCQKVPNFLEVKIDINQVILTPCPVYRVFQKLPLGADKDEHFSFFQSSCQLKLPLFRKCNSCFKSPNLQNKYSKKLSWAWNLNLEIWKTHCTFWEKAAFRVIKRNWGQSKTLPGIYLEFLCRTHCDVFPISKLMFVLKFSVHQISDFLNLPSVGWNNSNFTWINL